MILLKNPLEIWINNTVPFFVCAYVGTIPHSFTFTSRQGCGIIFCPNSPQQDIIIARKECENRLIEVKYDGDGRRLKATVSGITTAFITSTMLSTSGAHFEWTGSTSTMVKYYYAGSQRLAMRTGSSANTNLKWLVGDHLGSTSVTADYAGTLISRTLYKPWGGRKRRNEARRFRVRYQSGTLPTKYTFTGQYSHTADFGLMYYVARWYDPYLNRFIQPDSIVPNASNPMDWDRYAYARNNPIRYNDPDGHFPWIPLILVGLFIASISGDSRDYDPGITTVEQTMDPTKDSIVVAAGIAVQSEFYNPMFDGQRTVLYSYTGTGLGIAQVSDSQMVEYGVEGDQLDPAVAIEAMTARIDRIVSACTGCNARDSLIAAALAQNGSWITPEIMADAVKRHMDNGSMDWERFFGRFGSKGFPYDQLAAGHQNFDTRYMVYKFLQKLRALQRKGWALPDGITEEDLKYMENLSQGGFE